MSTLDTKAVLLISDLSVSTMAHALKSPLEHQPIDALKPAEAMSTLEGPGRTMDCIVRLRRVRIAKPCNF